MLILAQGISVKSGSFHDERPCRNGIYITTNPQGMFRSVLEGLNGAFRMLPESQIVTRCGNHECCDIDSL